ncbi:uncharacterized protein LOC122251229 isoform X7 [Penaeus japonicus]|uniref:uncharacterized protein LOC122251229 isoform X7 n=1 Tax=Penaeus japonicus TaxID=27405 RepID=UPI001C70CF3B|nr:uncharacterized protein LOC122251229 isoform X7 [Penaeus japonicus]
MVGFLGRSHIFWIFSVIPSLVGVICGRTNSENAMNVVTMDICMNSSEIIDDGEKCIQKLLWRLRHEDATQYNTLVKMHLSFATDLPTDQRIAVHIHRCDGREQPTGRKWHITPLIRRLGRAGNGKGVMEGAPLTQEGVCQAFQLIHYLNKDYNITQEGIFRKSGSLTRQQELKNLLNSGGDLNLDYGVYSAHDCASVLKSFLADLPEPLLTEAHYSIHCKIAEMHQSHMSQEQKEVAHSRQIKALRLLFLLLPSENYQLLQDLLILLHRVAAYKEQNLMSAINLGTMFAPHILCPRKMAPNDLQYLSGTLSTSVAFMIENEPQLFKVPLELEYDVRQYWNNKKKMKHQLSKRSMMDAPTSTIFTFIDRELTAQANDKDVTEVALAELYAYVQSLPDSAKKRRLIKQFNHASGSGTPQLNQSFLKRQEARGKRLGDSIKKHLFHKNVKNTKNKSQPFSSVGSVRVKRTNSEDLLSSPSTRSPELRMFRRNADIGTPDRLRAKSLDDLSSPSNEYLSSGKSQMIIHPAFLSKTHRLASKKPLSISLRGDFAKERHYSASSDQDSKVMMTPRSRCPIIINSTTSLSNVAIPEEKDSQNTPVVDMLRTKENSAEDDTSHNSPVIANPAAKLSSPVRSAKPLADTTNLSINTIDSEMMNDTDYGKGKAPANRKKRDSEGSCENEGETKLKRWGSSTLRRTLSSASSTGSLFGNFFRHLSTSSLAQLATRLSSTTSLINPEVQEEEKSDESENEEDGEMNESLSSVFKDYLLSRSILTDNPVDLSTDCLEKGIEEEDKESQEIPQTTDSNEENSDDNLVDSAYGESQPPSKSVSRQCSKASLGSADSALDLCPNKELSESLLFCLDGNNPLSPAQAVIDKNKEQIQPTNEGIFTPDRDTSAEEQVERLHSCSPESRRQSILKTKQGTPVPQWDKVHTESGGSTRGVLFETSF